MRNILEALYNGDIQPNSRGYEQDSRFVHLTNLKDRNLNELMGMLNDSERSVFEKYRDVQDEIVEVIRYGTYAYTLKLGILLMAEVFMTGAEVCGAECEELY